MLPICSSSSVFEMGFPFREPIHLDKCCSRSKEWERYFVHRLNFFFLAKLHSLFSTTLSILYCVPFLFIYLFLIVGACFPVSDRVLFLFLFIFVFLLLLLLLFFLCGKWLAATWRILEMKAGIMGLGFLASWCIF